MRNRDTSAAELRLLAAVRWSIREQGGEPSSPQAVWRRLNDELHPGQNRIDERLDAAAFHIQPLSRIDGHHAPACKSERDGSTLPSHDPLEIVVLLLNIHPHFQKLGQPMNVASNRGVFPIRRQRTSVGLATSL